MPNDQTIMQENFDWNDKRHRLKPFIEPFKQEKEEINLLEPQKA